MDDTLVALPNTIVMIVSNRSENCYVYITDVIEDKKPGWWKVTFKILLPTKDFKPLVKTWILDNQQIRGQEFTMGEHRHQLRKTDMTVIQDNTQEPTKQQIPIFEPKKHKREIPPYLRLVK